MANQKLNLIMISIAKPVKQDINQTEILLLYWSQLVVSIILFQSRLMFCFNNKEWNISLKS